MAQAISIRYRVEFNFDNDPKDFKFVDIVAAAYNTTYGLTLANIKGLVKVVSPNGITVYANAGYASDDFSSPDIDGNTLTWEQDLGSLPLDNDGNVELGYYTFYYKLSTDGGTTVYNSGNENEKQYNLNQYTSPTVSIDMSVSCRTSELTSVDSTDYTISVDSANIEPSIVRAHKIVKPEGAACTIPATASTDEISRTIGAGGTVETDIYTGIWQTHLTSTLVYDMELWGADVWVQVMDEVTGYDHIGVVCADCLCDMKNCIDNLYLKWIASIGVESRTRVDDLKQKNLKVAINFILYEVAERCGEDSSDYCDAISEILVSEECTCGTSDDDVPTRVIAWGNSLGTGGTPATPSAWLYGSADPTAGLGANGDYYLQLGTGIAGVNGDVWYKSAGSWTHIGNINGADGSSSTASDYILYSVDPTDDPVDGVANEQVLKDLSLSSSLINANGDIVEVDVLFELAENTTEKIVRVYFGGVEFGEYTVTGTVTSVSKYIKAKMTICRIDVSNQLITCEFFRSGVPGKTSGPNISAGTADLSITNLIEASGISTPGGADNIICKQLTVEIKQLYSAP